MKKVLGLLLCGALGLQAQAQQLPNGDLSQWKAEGESGASYASFSGSMAKRPGVEPMEWNSGNVSQFGFVNIKDLCVKGEEEGSENGYAVLTNRFVGLGTIGSPAPGFINLGTPWVFATFTMMAEDAKKLGDGGAYGGMDFTYRPDAVRCKVKKTAVEGETSHIIAYLWNGTFLSQAPADIVQDEESKAWSVSKLTVLQDVDRAVLGRESEDRMIQKGTLVASCDYELTEDIAEWTTVTVPFEYKNNQTPSKINVIVAAGDYWTRTSLNVGSELCVDDIELLYYSTLSGININGVPVADFNAETLEYTVDAAYNSMAFEAVAAGAGATVETVYNAEEKKATVTVKGADIESNPENVTVYTVTFTGEATSAFLPNSDFTEWKAEGASGSSLNTTEPNTSRLRPGIEPMAWNSGNVNQLGLAKSSELCVKSETEEDGVYVTLTNKRVEVFGMGATAPGFITLANPWIFATSAMTSAAAQAYADGGSYGGQDFSSTPDAVQCKVKRTAVNSEVAHIVAYLWNGTFVSKVPNELKRSGSLFNYTYSIGGYTDMNDVDRVVMGRETNEEMIVERGTLVASCDYELTEDIAEWTTITVPLEYKSDEVPTKMNVIVSAGDYWNRSALQTGSTLSVDDLQFVYWTDLADLTIDGTTVDGFAKDIYEYTVDAPLTPSTVVAAQVAGRSAKADVQCDYVNAVATVTVKAADFDENPDNVTVYTLHFTKQAPALAALGYDGKTIELIDGTYAYTVEDIYDNTEVTYEAAEGCSISALPEFDLATRTVTLTVSGANIGYDPEDQVTYTITFGEYPSVLTSLAWKGEPLADFAADKLEYEIDDYYNYRLSDLSYEAGTASVSRTWDEATQTYTLTVKAKDAEIYPEHQTVYTVRHNSVLVQSGKVFFSKLEGTYKAVVDLTLQAGWNVLCLPFDVTATDLFDGAKVTQLSQYGADYGLVFTPVEGERMQAYVPYLVYSPTDISEQPVTLENVTFGPGEGATVKPDNSVVSFIGTTRSYGGTDLYTLSTEGAAEKVAGTLVTEGSEVRVTISAMSGYFVFDEGVEPGSLVVNIDMTNAIDKVETVADGKYTVVTLSGVTLRSGAGSLEGLKPGIYVINGKTTVVK